jgi:hypothetical protein
MNQKNKTKTIKIQWHLINNRNKNHRKRMNNAIGKSLNTRRNIRTIQLKQEKNQCLSERIRDIFPKIQEAFHE